jgi:hypothetical protein
MRKIPTPDYAQHKSAAILSPIDAENLPDVDEDKQFVSFRSACQAAICKKPEMVSLCVMTCFSENIDI